ncbi:MAG TPA: MaoC family dehydratase N-terminal domain-containing protein [Isosphaeraceae bacterium]|nr:MaoC family dehydratase N-terminal domain-containing protein [Isosphaeraceae bacterium]
MIAPAPAQAAAAMLDDPTTEFVPGSPLPPLWQWFFFLPRVPQSRLGPDGHPQRGGFMPPIELPRRMFAGARMRFFKPLIIGKPARRRSAIRDVSEKDGRTGKLAFVTVAQSVHQDGEVRIEEEQDIVYREPGAPVGAPESCELPPAPAGSWTRLITPDPTLLFRFSALTFNAHRIHYDRTYATTMEGYPGLVVHGPLTAVLLMELVRFHSHRSVVAFAFRGQAPLFDLAPFRLIGTPVGERVHLEAQGPDGKTTMTASADLA